MTTLDELRKRIRDYGLGGGMIPILPLLRKEKEWIYRYEDTVYYCSTFKFNTCYKVEEFQTLKNNLDKLFEEGWKKTEFFNG
jgi:hypothetical protein